MTKDENLQCATTCSNWRVYFRTITKQTGASSIALMASRPRTRKRVCAVRRASDGSAFEKCERCGISVAVALADMHQCEPDKGVKRFRGINVNHHVPNHSFGDQPISPFRLFMEDFVKDCETADMIEIDRSGFEVWKNMSKEQRQPYVSQAEKVNSAYEEALNKEVNDMIQVDDEADSAMVGKFDKFHQSYEESSEYSEYYTEFSGQDDWFLIDGATLSNPNNESPFSSFQEEQGNLGLVRRNLSKLGDCI